MKGNSIGIEQMVSDCEMDVNGAKGVVTSSEVDKLIHLYLNDIYLLVEI